MSVVPVLATVFSVLLALTTGGLILIRRCWPLRPSTEVATISWIEDEEVSAARPVPSGDPGTGARAGVTVRAVRWRWAGMAVGVVGAMAVGGSARGAMVAWPVFGLGVLAGTFAGELDVRAPTGPVRSAQLRVRRLLDYIPRPLGALVGVAATALFALAFVAGPWFGVYHAVPVLCVVVAGLVLAGFVLRRVVRRPRMVDVVQVDDVSRRRSAEVVIAAAGILVLTPLLGIAATARVEYGSPGPLPGAAPLQAFVGPALSGLAVVAFLAAAWCAGFLLMPSTRSAGRRAA